MINVCSSTFYQTVVIRKAKLVGFEPKRNFENVCLLLQIIITFTKLRKKRKKKKLIYLLSTKVTSWMSPHVKLILWQNQPPRWKRVHLSIYLSIYLSQVLLTSLNILKISASKALSARLDPLQKDKSPPKKGVLSKLPLAFRFEFWKSGECEIPFHRHYFSVHSDWSGRACWISIYKQKWLVSNYSYNLIENSELQKTGNAPLKYWLRVASCPGQKGWLNT